MLALTYSPHDASRKNVNHESCIRPLPLGRYIGEVRYPQLVGAVDMELPLHAIHRADGLNSRHRCPHELALPYVLQAGLTPQDLHGTESNVEALTSKLLPDFAEP